MTSPTVVDYWAALRAGDRDALDAADRARLEHLERLAARLPAPGNAGARERLLRALAHAVRENLIDHARRLAKQEEQTR